MKTRAFMALAVAVLLVPMLARADLTVKEQTDMSGMMGMLSSKGTETTYIKGDKMRSESQTEMTGGMAGMMQGSGKPKTQEMLTITRLDKGVIWLVNPSDSTYIEVPLKMPASDSLGSGGIKVKDVSVKNTGQSKDIVGYKCDGVEVDVTYEAAMGQGKDQQPQTGTMATLFWMRPEVKDLEDLRHFWDQMVDVVRVSQKGSPMAAAMAPLFAKVKEIKGVPLGMEMTMANPMGGQGNQEQSKQAMKMMQQMMKNQGKAPAQAPAETENDSIKVTRQVTSLSKDALSDALFELPKGYKKTTQPAPRAGRGMPR